ncbi:ribbon-helix-helix domain-containing protein [Brucella grignonensis]|nr:ribbon-helix-helix domain-containing protein [Brucella grignonensis]
MFAEIDPQFYESQIRSVRLNGHSTSVRLEVLFWNILDEIAREENNTIGRFLSRLHNEVLHFNGEASNFTSLLRCACLRYIQDKGSSIHYENDIRVINLGRRLVN